MAKWNNLTYVEVGLITHKHPLSGDHLKTPQISDPRVRFWDADFGGVTYLDGTFNAKQRRMA